MLEARHTKQAKAICEMKTQKGKNWKMQYTWVALDQPVEKKIVSMEINSGEKGKTLSIYLKIVQDDFHIEGMTAKPAGLQSPM